MAERTRARLAIVEDEFIVALDIKNIVQKAGYEVVGVFPSGDELLSRFEQIAPELVLMDIRIKGSLDGVETAGLVHERYGVPVVLLTAYADEDTVSRAKLSQPFGYIIKPFEERELRTAVEIALYRGGMERKIRESEERYRSLFHEGLSANFIADAEGRVLEANRAFRELLGLGAEEALPSLPELFPDRLAWEAVLAALRSDGRLGAAELGLLRGPTKEGEPPEELAVIANLRLLASPGGAAPAGGPASGASAGFQGEFFDATARRRLEERLAQSQKMEAVGRLAGGVAHDFNNVLTAIMGYANLLAEELGEEGRLREDVEGIRKAAGKAANLTRQLLAFSRRQSSQPRRVALDGLVADLERMLGRLLPADITLKLRLGGGRESCAIADPTQVEQVVVNLVVNARDAMASGGRIELDTALRRLDSPFHAGLDTLAPGDYVVLGVSDEGTGVPPAIADRIFEPFFTTKPRDHGTGLGLSTVYGIMKQLGGAVRLAPGQARGARFEAWFPLAAGAEPGSVESSEARPGRLKLDPLTVLLVDDDEGVRDIAQRILESRGCRVLSAANPGEALLLAESYGSGIGLLVTDLVMPLMDGRRLAERVRSLSPCLPVLFISGHPEREEALAGERFLSKPFDEAGFLEAVKASVRAPAGT